MLQWNECTQAPSTNLDPVLEPQYQPTSLEEETKQTLESLNNIYNFLNLLKYKVNILLIAYETLVDLSKPKKKLNLRNKPDNTNRWVRVILDKSEFIANFFDELNILKTMPLPRIRRLDLVIPKGTISLRSTENISVTSIALFELKLDLFYGTDEYAYVSLSHKKLESWSDSTTKIIRGNDNEHIKKLTSLTSLS